LEEKKVTRIGMARFIEENCLSCGICVNKCPTGALTMMAAGGKNLPYLDGQYCIGCGACKFSCPAPNKAFDIIPVFEQIEATQKK
jgi:ferredoxin